MNMSDEISGNVIRPFQLESSSLRGRIVRLDTVLDEILVPHGYPDIVSQLLAEATALCGLLSSMLKYEGIFTLQIQGDGPVSMLVCDTTSGGGVRSCASFDEKRVEKVRKQLLAFAKDEVGEGSDNHLVQLMGKGHIAFTVDQPEHTDRYQGIVELKGTSLVECVQHYFIQSEQINTGIKLAVGQRNGLWRASGIMLQHMPSDGGNAEVDHTKTQFSNFDEDDWRRAMIYMQSCTEDELLSPELSAHEILIRLFHEDGVRVYDPIPVIHSCRCSQERVDNLTQMMSVDELQEMIDQDQLTMTCEFCSKDYHLDKSRLNKIIKESSQSV